MVKNHVDSGKVLRLKATEMILAISQQKKKANVETLLKVRLQIAL